MRLEDALGEAVTGHDVTCQHIGLENRLTYDIGKGWRVVEASGREYPLPAVNDPDYAAQEWYYWREPIRGAWGKTETYIYTPADAVLKVYDWPDAPIPEVIDRVEEAFGAPPELPPRPSAPWGNETVLYRDYEIYRDSAGAMCGFNWQYTHKDYDGPEVDNRGGVCKTFTECLDEIDEELDP